METPRKILLIQLKRIGDVLLTTPATTLVRKAYPQAQITFMTQGVSAEIYRDNPDVNHVWQVPGRISLWGKIGLLGKVRKAGFDMVVDFMANPATALIALASGATVRIGFNKRVRRLVYTHRGTSSPDSSYSPDDNIHLLQAIGISGQFDCLTFPVSDEARAFAQMLMRDAGIGPEDRLVTCSPVSRQPYKVWPAQSFAAVNDFLIQEYRAKIFFLWGPGEEHFVDAVISAMKESPLEKADVNTLQRTRAVIDQAWMHVGNDNAIRHFAIAADVATVGIFGKTRARNWTPPGSAEKHLAFDHDPGCKSSCVYPKCRLECLNGITPEQVVAEIRRVF